MSHGTQNELAAIDQVVERLTQQLPDLPPDRVRSTVSEVYRSHEDAKVRDFVPVIVEREAKSLLTQPT